MRVKEFLVDGAHLSQILEIPLISRDPDSFKSALSFEAYDLLLRLKNLVHELNQKKQNPSLMKLTRDRLTHLEKSYAENAQLLEPLLRSLGHEKFPFSVTKSKNQGNPSRLLTQYYAHIFRDWCWGENEILATLEVIKKLPMTSKKIENILTIGAGACRFPYEIHRWLRPDYSLAVDINPFPLSIASKVIRGDVLELYDFPTLPNRTSSFATKSLLKAPEKITEGMEFIVHNIEEWAIKDHSFDLVVTPWVIDVMPISPSSLFALLNRVLKPGGIWLNFGPTGFNKGTLEKYWSEEEVLFAAKKSQFKILGSQRNRVPYLHCPDSGHWRIENILSFTAEKIDESSVSEIPEPTGLPVWVEETQKPIELSNSIQNLKQGYEFSVFILEELKSKVSIDELAAKVTDRYGFSLDQAKYLVTGMLLQWQQPVNENPIGSE